MINFEEIITHKQNFFKTKYQGNILDIDKDIKKIIKKDQGRNKSNVGGYQSNLLIHDFESLKSFVCDCMKELCEGVDFNLDCYWLNINKGTDYNKTHIHNVNIITCVYYHKICCRNTPIVFEHLVPQIINKKVPFYPENQDLIFFYGVSPHSVKGCGNKKHKRISIAFNFEL
tara:strand:+ start:178 stop:693 length:516 start_codon:yes stop_codon:yes gene_type:complete